jgi:hypothetical protein
VSTICCLSPALLLPSMLLSYPLAFLSSFSLSFFIVLRHAGVPLEMQRHAARQPSTVLRVLERRGSVCAGSRAFPLYTTVSHGMEAWIVRGVPSERCGRKQL